MPLPFAPSCTTAIDANAFQARAHRHLRLLYGERADEVLRRLMVLLAHQAPPADDTLDAPRWSERDRVLSTGTAAGWASKLTAPGWSTVASTPRRASTSSAANASRPGTVVPSNRTAKAPQAPRFL
mgnify:CR=1 FL=1